MSLKRTLKAIIPPFLWNPGVRIKNRLRTRYLKGLRRLSESSGYTVARESDYYSPLNSVAQLRAKEARWNQPSALRGVDYDLEAMKADFADLASRYLEEFLALPPYRALQQEGFGPGYTAVDAFTLYATVRHLKPRLYMEVGSGLSTYYCSLAAARNAAEGSPLAITCIEPYPYARLNTIPGIRLLVKEVQEVEALLFQELEAGDILFIDSSHVVRIDGDVPFLFLEVLPALKTGVTVHVHDIPFPYNVPYPASHWVFGQEWPMLWNEAMLLQAFLCFNPRFRITLSAPVIRHFDEAFLEKMLPFYETIRQNANTFSSIWLKRVA